MTSIAICINLQVRKFDFSREVSKRRFLLLATLEACTAYCKRVLEQMEQGILTEPTSKTKVDTPEKEGEYLAVCV